MTADIITSRGNHAFKKLLSLHTSRGIKENRMFLASGEKLIHEILAERAESIVCLIRTPRMSHPPALPAALESLTFSNELFNELNVTGAAGPLLAMHRPDLENFSANAPWPAGCTLFIPFGDPENVGAVIRSAAGLGASRVVLLKEAACPFLPRAIRSSAGAVLRVRMEYGPSLDDLSFARNEIPVFALDMRGKNIAKTAWPPAFGLVAGMEGGGLPEKIRTECSPISIPLQNNLESLNAAAAVSIALWTWKGRACS